MNDKVRFNVIIPTRERADTLFHCLRTVVAQTYQNLNVIVSDNASQDNTREVVESFSDPRLKYINTGKRLSMSHNWEFALGHVGEGWVIYVGDDDGLVPDSIADLSALVEKYDVEAISSSRLLFVWPGDWDWSNEGKLNLSFMNREVVKDSRVMAWQVLNGEIPYYELPGLYSGGAASIDLINELRDSSGRFFCSQAPDLYSAIALSLGTRRYLRVDQPFVVSGVSRHSTGVSYRVGKTSKQVTPATQFKSEDNIPFHSSLILGKSFEIVLYECYLQSWHIHHGNLKISLESQLNNAIERAPSDLLQMTHEDCQKIAEINGIDYRFSGSRWRSRIRRAPYYLSRVFFTQYFSARSLGIKNVYDAAVQAGNIYRLRSRARLGLPFLLMCGFVRLGCREAWKVIRKMKSWFVSECESP